MENQSYQYYNNTGHKIYFSISIPLLITILLTFISFILFLFLFFLLLNSIKNFTCKYVCLNTPCKRKKRKKGIQIKMGSLSHKIVIEKA
jgi:hypothetical protein